MNFTQRMDNLLKERNTNWKEVCEQLGIGKNQPKYWERNNTMPDGKTLIKLAEHFNVTTDFLLGIDILKEKALLSLDNPELVLSADEKWFVLKLRQLDKDGRSVVEGTLVAELRRVEEKRNAVSAG